MQTTIAENLQKVRNRMKAAAEKVRRDPDEVALVVVTKAQPIEVVQMAIAAGAGILGENYAEEAAGKIALIGSHPKVQWHMIGHVQSRKARLVCENFNFVHSLDSVKLAERFQLFAQQLDIILPVLLEINLGGEDTKSGWRADAPSQWDRLFPDIDHILGFSHLKVRGLMTMPPFFNDPEQGRPYFQNLRRLQEFLALRFPAADWTELSMGTSVDFEVAIQEGATLVRVGQAIVGPRPKNSLQRDEDREGRRA